MKNIFISLILTSLLMSLAAEETRYSRAIRAYNKAIIEPIKPQLPTLIKKLTVYKKNESKLKPSQKREMESIAFTLKQYYFITKLNAIFHECHKNLLLFPKDHKNADQDSSPDLNTDAIRQARKELKISSKAIQELLDEYPEVIQDPKIMKIMRKAFATPKKKKRKQKRSEA